VRLLPLAAWCAACATVLVFTLAVWEPGLNSDAGEVFAWGMLWLTFPAGLLVPAGIALFATYFGATELATSLGGSVGFAVAWAGFVLVGYAQWFWLVPKLWRRVRSLRGAAV
jgi:hypothetical protein